MLEPLVQDILWILAGVGTFWAVTPTVLELLGFGFEASQIDEDPAAAEPGEDDADCRRAYRELWDLGFRPAGREVRTVRFLIGAWRLVVEARWLAMPDGRCFAALCRLIPGAPLRVHLSTCTAEGGQVVSVTPPEGVHLSDDKWHRVDARKGPLAEVLAAHRAEIDSFTRRRGTEVSSESFRTAVDVNRALDEHMVRSKRWVFAAMTGFFFIVPALLIYFLCVGIDPPGGTRADYAAVGLFVGTLGYMFYRYALLPFALRHSDNLMEANQVRQPDKRGASDGND
jgi:hypothetical protein